jgi:ubiquinone/menaquinone biosynthesis C-methylase UbiE
MGPSEQRPSEQSLRVAAVFDRAAATYDSVGVDWFTPIAQGLVRELAPRPGERAVDIGCGRGAALFPLAEAVGSAGHVTGFDLSSEMVRTTRDDVTARGLSNVDLVVVDASMPTLEPASFDVACASLVAFFLPDPLAGLRAWLALLAPGGRLGISTFGPRDQTWVEVDALFRPYLPPQMLDARTTGDAGPFASDAGVEGLLTDAGFHQPRTVSRQMSTTFADGEQWHTWSWSHGQRAMWEFVPEAERPSVKERALDVLRRRTDTDGRLSLTQEVRYTLGDRDPA